MLRCHCGSVELALPRACASSPSFSPPSSDSQSSRGGGPLAGRPTESPSEATPVVEQKGQGLGSSEPQPPVGSYLLQDSETEKLIGYFCVRCGTHLLGHKLERSGHDPRCYLSPSAFSASSTAELSFEAGAAEFFSEQPRWLRGETIFDFASHNLPSSTSSSSATSSTTCSASAVPTHHDQPPAMVRLSGTPRAQDRSPASVRLPVRPAEPTASTEESGDEEFPRLDPLPAGQASAWLPHSLHSRCTGQSAAEEQAAHIAFLERHLLHLREKDKRQALAQITGSHVDQAARGTRCSPSPARCSPSSPPSSGDSPDSASVPRSDPIADSLATIHISGSYYDALNPLDRIASIPLLEADGGLDAVEIADLVSIEEMAAVVRDAEERVDRMLAERRDQSTEITDPSSVWQWDSSSSSSSSSSTSSASSSSSSSASEPEMVINRDQVYSYRMLSDADHEFQHVPLADEEEEVEEETASTEQPELFAGNTIPSFEMRWDDSEPFDAALDQPIQ